MLEWIKRLFCKTPPQPEQVPEIKAGELWLFQPAPDPWGEKKYSPVKIIDVRDGWVRYDMGGFVFRDERRPAKTFVSMYRRVDA